MPRGLAADLRGHGQPVPGRGVGHARRPRRRAVDLQLGRRTHPWRRSVQGARRQGLREARLREGMTMTTDISAIHRRALDATRPLVAGIRADQWDLPTPCDGWTVR